MLFKEKIPGLILCFIIAIPSWLLGLYLPLIGAPVFAIDWNNCWILLSKSTIV
ncbi:Putative membrane protein YeiH [Streptococcus agalactiae]|uniref:hypothetical protein n=1 Tax=Streptococcus agalactiae TaxID=1311 RepID=UPI000D973FC1|nr:Putative membrane protein YeiH [Streptococcus agalactiae]